MEIEFKPGDRVIVPGALGLIGKVVEIGLVRVNFENTKGKFISQVYDPHELKPAPEPLITDAERVAAMSHNHFGKLRQGMTGYFLESSLSAKPFGGNTATEALDAWVRHLRSTGWKADKGE